MSNDAPTTKNAEANPTPSPTKAADSSSSSRKPAVGDHVWYRDYSGALFAIVSEVKTASPKYASLAVLTRAGTWLSRQDCPRHDKSQFAFPTEGCWSFDKSDLE